MSELENLPVAQFQRPRLPIPPPVWMSQPGSFAHATLTQRWPAIGRRTIAQNDFTPEIVENLEALLQELPYGVVRSLKDDNGPDLVAWASYLEPFVGEPWIDLPWYFAESYFYRRILEATQYFLPGPWRGVDPFESQKRASLETTMDAVRVISNQLHTWSNTQLLDSAANRDNLIALLYSDLWGNKADLSLFATVTDALSHSETKAQAKHTHILVDDTAILVDRLPNFQAGRIDFIIDNVGLELVSDLYLADFLLVSNTASTVYLHLKAHPTFVSDATIEDVHYTLKVLASDCEMDVRSLADRLKSHIASSRLQLREDFFWTAPLAFWEMPQPLHQELAQASLIFVKGDANYRRLLGDCQWPFTTRFEDIVCYFPAPFVALRTLKSQVAAGLKSSQVETLNREDPQWLSNGQWGVIQFADPSRFALT